MTRPVLTFTPRRVESDQPGEPPLSVDIADIVAERAAGWAHFHPEVYCHRCGQRNPPWWTPNWYDAAEIDGGWSIICPTCFVELYGFLHGPTVWTIRRDEVGHMVLIPNGAAS